MATAVVMIAPVLAFAIAVQRYLVVDHIGERSKGNNALCSGGINGKCNLQPRHETIRRF